jgi:glucarate dehydratase
MTLTIDRIQAIPVNVPYCRIPLMAGGVSGYSTRTIIIIETSSGICGLGEASYAFPADIITREFAPALIGLDALDHAGLRRHCLPVHLDFGTPSLKTRLAAWGGLEIALWDILSKHAGLPLYKMLGGACRRQAPFGAYAYAEEDPVAAPVSMARRAQEAIACTGASLFEFKIGVHPVEVEIETVRAVHDVLADRAAIAVDANMGMTLEAAHRFLAAAAPCLENIEEPVASLPHMEQLSRQYGVNVSTHCSDPDIVIHYPGIAGIVPTLDVAGGIASVRRLSELLNVLGRRIWLRSHAETGIGWAAMVHLGISLPSLERPGQSLIDLLEDDLILGDRWSVQNGGVMPPELPGLGVELDEEALRHYHEIHLQVGEVPAFPPAARRLSALHAA